MLCFRLRPCTRLWGLAHISVCCSIQYIFFLSFRHSMAHTKILSENLLTLYAMKILKILTEIQQKGKWDRSRKNIINRCRQMRKKSCWSHSHKFIYFYFLLNVFPITVFAIFLFKRENMCIWTGTTIITPICMRMWENFRIRTYVYHQVTQACRFEDFRRQKSFLLVGRDFVCYVAVSFGCMALELCET